MSGGWSGGNWSYATTTTTTTTGDFNTNNQKLSETTATIDNSGRQLFYV